MKSSGFKLREESGQIILDFLLPETLRGVFKASFYGRSDLLDMAEGRPSVIWENFADGTAPRKPLVAPCQKHGKTIVDACAKNALPVRPAADGVYIGSNSDACASLRFADCVPVVAACAGAEPWMLILHSGFAGTVKNIVGTALSEAFKRNGTSDVGKTYAWIAPAICPECYTRRADDASTQKGQEVFAPHNYVRRGELVHFNLKGEIKTKISEQGILPENIYVSGFCTHCRNDKFYSYRAGDEKCRNFLFAANTTKTAY